MVQCIIPRTTLKHWFEKYNQIWESKGPEQPKKMPFVVYIGPETVMGKQKNPAIFLSLAYSTAWLDLLFTNRLAN